MKKTLIMGALLAGAATGAFAQGTIVFNDHLSTFAIHIYAPQTDNPAVQVTGNAANDKPAGTQAGYNGGLVGGSGTGSSLANGNDVSVELYALGGTTLAAASSLLPVTQYVSTISTLAAGAGIFNPVSLGASDPGIPNTPAGSATVALAAWYNGGGAYTSLAAAQGAGQAAGESTPVLLTGLGNVSINGNPPGQPIPLTGVQSFSLTTSTPEPSTIALGIMGASAFLLRRRMSK